MNDRTHSGRRALIAIVAVAVVVAICSWSPSAARAEDDVTRAREVAAFDRVRLDGAFSATIVAGTSTHFAMTGRPGDLARVTVAVEGGRLSIGLRAGSDHISSIALEIATPTLRSFENEGAGSARLSGLHGDLDLENHGAASIDASGRAGQLTIVNAGVGKFDATALDARDATVTNNGVGGIIVRTSGSLVMNLNGIGDIRYAGKPSHVESNVNGLGRTHPV